MADIQAFQALRYDLGHVGSLTDVIAPPYDVINSQFQNELYDRHPANVVRLILNREEPGDDANSRYERAARFLKNWKNEGVLQQEARASIYVYNQTFTVDGQTITRRGFMSHVRLERFGEGNIYPHEETHSAAKADRLKLISATKANLSQIFGIYPDRQNAAQNILEAACADIAPIQATDHLGVVHDMWVVDDIAVISEVASIMGDKPMYIADGHHRYETACNYRDQLAEQNGGSLPSDHPANYVLMMCVGMHDQGMVVLPTHRLFRGLPDYTSAELTEKLQDCFDVQTVGTGPEYATELWESIAFSESQAQIGLFAQADNTWLKVELNETGAARLKEIAAEHCEAWCDLGVSILHKLLLADLLGQEKMATPMYVHSIEETIEAIQQGDSVGRDATGQEGSGGKFPLVALVMPATLEHIEQVSQEGERMPAKSTYFYPKLLSGLLINPLE